LVTSSASLLDGIEIDAFGREGAGASVIDATLEEDDDDEDEDEDEEEVVVVEAVAGVVDEDILGSDVVVVGCSHLLLLFFLVLILSSQILFREPMDSMRKLILLIHTVALWVL